MALRGRVADYGLADILQLVSQGSRSGHLRIEQNSDIVDMFLSSGTVVDVRSRDTGYDGPLGLRLVKARLISDTELGDVLATRAETGESLGDIITRQSLLDSATIRHHATLLRWDALLGPFTWRYGQYAFTELPVEHTDPWTDPITVDHLLLKGVRLVEEWSWAQTHIPSLAWVIARRLPLPPPAEEDDPFGAFDLLEPEEKPVQVGDEAREIHPLAIPGSVISNIIGCSPNNRYETMLSLAELSSKGYIVVSPY